MVLGFKKQFVPKILDGTKIHTIREDKNRRWKPGMKIHFATGVRTKNYNQFKSGVCTGVQRVVINPEIQSVNVLTDNGWRTLTEKQKTEFAKNDGFDTPVDFWNWFNEFFDGVIIHWTERRY